MSVDNTEPVKTNKNEKTKIFLILITENILFIFHLLLFIFSNKKTEPIQSAPTRFSSPAVVVNANDMKSQTAKAAARLPLVDQPALP